jgi:mutator protein MutT
MRLSRTKAFFPHLDLMGKSLRAPRVRWSSPSLIVRFSCFDSGVYLSSPFRYVWPTKKSLSKPRSLDSILFWLPPDKPPATTYRPLSDMIATQIIDVAAGLLFHGGKLLITQRLPHDHLAGLWEFPGGKREGDETFQECLRRELREELGIEVGVGALVDEVTHVYPEKAVHLKFFVCTLRQNEPRPLACHALAWVTANELRGYEFPPADTRILDKLQNEALWRSGQ